MPSGTSGIAASPNGNVGIGTANPTAWGTGASLEVDGAGGGVLAVKYSGASKGYHLAESDRFSINGWFSTPVVFFTSGSERVRIDGSGDVGIGATNSTHKLSVNSTLKAKEVVVETTGWSDYVFDGCFRMAPLSDVEQHIQQNGHLPEVPSAAEVAARGVSVGEMQTILLKKRGADALPDPPRKGDRGIAG